jgi:hypothetical protein
VPLAAGYLGVPASKLRREIRSGRSLAELAARTPGHSASELINRLVAARAAALTASAKLTPEQRRKRLALLRTRMTAVVNRHGARLSIGDANLLAAAHYLGLHPVALQTELQRGRTLAQVANATPGHSAAGLIAALVAIRRAALKGAVAAGRISPQQEAQLLATLQARLTAIVNRVPVS